MKRKLSVTTGDAAKIVRDAVSGESPQGKEPRSWGATISVSDETRELVRRGARERGVTQDAIIRTALTPPSYVTSPAMRDAQVLVRIADLLRAGDVERAREVVRDAMRALAKEHAHAMDADPRAWDGT